MKTLVGKFMVCSSLAALLVASLVAIVGPAHEFSCEGLAHCFQFVVLLLDAAMCMRSSCLQVALTAKKEVKRLFLKVKYMESFSPRLSVSVQYFCEQELPLECFSSFAAALSSSSQQLRSVQVRQ